MNLGMLLGNVGVMGIFMVSDDLIIQLVCLGIIIVLFSIMGVIFIVVIGGQYNIYRDYNFCLVLLEINNLNKFFIYFRVLG